MEDKIICPNCGTSRSQDAWNRATEDCFGAGIHTIETADANDEFKCPSCGQISTLNAINLFEIARMTHGTILPIERLKRKRRRQIRKYEGHVVGAYKHPKKLWDLCYYLADDLYHVLKLFKKENIHSVPAEFAGKPIGWHNILDEMIWSFQQIKDNYPNDPMDQFFDVRPFKDLETNEYKIEPFSNKDHELFEKYRLQSKEYHSRVQHGLYLFAKYFRDLWD